MSMTAVMTGIKEFTLRRTPRGRITILLATCHTQQTDANEKQLDCATMWERSRLMLQRCLCVSLEQDLSRYFLHHANSCTCFNNLRRGLLENPNNNLRRGHMCTMVAYSTLEDNKMGDTDTIKWSVKKDCSVHDATDSTLCGHRNARLAQLQDFTSD